MRKLIHSIVSIVAVALACLAVPPLLAQSNYQQQQRQQDMQRQQQEQQRQQMQAQQRQQQQDQQRQQMQQQQRQQMQEQQRQQMQAQQRQQMQMNQRQQVQTQMQAQQRQQTAEQQRQQMQRQGTLGKEGKPSGMVVSGGVARMTRPLTPGEIQRGFTGKVTPDGKALIKFQNRIFTVPASRVSGLAARLAASQNQTTQSASWSAQKRDAVNQRVKLLAAGGGPECGTPGNPPCRGGGGNGSNDLMTPTGSANPCTPPSSPKCQFNNAANNRIEQAKLTKIGIIESAEKAPSVSNFRRGDSTGVGTKRFDYSATFDDDLVRNFNPGYKKFSGALKEDMLLVQYHRSDRALGDGRSAAYWTTHSEGNKFATIDEVRKNLALPPGWGPRDAVSVARIPKGTVVEFAGGSAREKIERNASYDGGGFQYLFKDFDPSWIVETRKMEE